MKVSWALVSDVGKVRNSNQDCVIGLELNNQYYAFIVCDGMGGANGGEVASSLAITTTTDLLKQRDWKQSDFNPTILNNILQEVNLKIFNHAKDHPELSGMGTTFTMFIFNSTKGYLVQIGDSRLYLIDDRRIQQLSKDQSYVQELFDQGLITKEKMKVHPKRHMLTNALGTSEDLQPSFTYLSLYEGTYLLCSDGLTNEVSDILIKETILKKSDSLSQKINNLLALALLNGGRDNVSIIGVSLE
jgi:protein phosphatase